MADTYDTTRLDYRVHESNYPNQRTTIKEKANRKFYIPTYDYLINHAISNKSSIDTKAHMEYANGIVDSKTYDYILKPFQKMFNKDDKSFKLPGEIRDIDFISEIREKTIARYLSLPSDYTVTTDSIDLAAKRNEHVRSELSLFLQSKFIELISKSKETGQMPEELQDIEKYVKSLSSEFSNNKAIEAKQILDLINSIIKLDAVRVQQYFYWWATEEVYDYRRLYNGEFEYYIVPPEEGFPIKDNKFDDVADGMAFVWASIVSYDDILTTHKEELSNEDVKYLEAIVLKDNNYFIPKGALTSKIDAYKEFYSGSFDLNKDYYSVFAGSQVIKKYVINWKTQVPVSILRYEDEFGTPQEMVVPPYYKLDKTNGDISIEKTWIYEAWEGMRIGDDLTGLYTAPKPVSVQRRDKHNPSRCKLSFSGRQGILKGINVNPIPKRLIDFQAIDKIINLNIEREMAKFKGNIMTVPESLLDSKGYDAAQRMFYVRADGILIYNDGEMSGDEISKAVRVIGNPGLEKYLETLINYSEFNRARAFEVGYMNDEMRGYTKASALKSNTEQNIYRAQLGNMLSLQTFNNYLQCSYEANLEFSKYAWIDGKTGSYFDTNTNKVVYLNIDGAERLIEDYNVRVSNAEVDAKKLDEYKNFAFSAAQGQEFEMASEVIHATSSPEARELIKDISKAKKDYEAGIAASNAQMEQAKVQAEQQKIAAEEQKSMLEREYKEWETMYKENAETERKIMDVQVDLLKLGESGSNGDSALKNELDNRLATLQENQARMKNDLDKRALDIKEKDIASKERIAKTNKNRYDK